MENNASNSPGSRNQKWNLKKISKWLSNISAIVTIVTFIALKCDRPDVRSVSLESSNGVSTIDISSVKGKLIFYQYLDFENFGNGAFLNVSAVLADYSDKDSILFNANSYVKDNLAYEFNSIYINRDLDGHFKFVALGKSLNTLIPGKIYNLTVIYLLSYKFIFIDKRQLFSDSFIFTITEPQLKRINDSSLELQIFRIRH